MLGSQPSLGTALFVSDRIGIFVAHIRGIGQIDRIALKRDLYRFECRNHLGIGQLTVLEQLVILHRAVLGRNAHRTPASVSSIGQCRQFEAGLRHGDGIRSGDLRILRNDGYPLNHRPRPGLIDCRRPVYEFRLPLHVRYAGPDFDQHHRRDVAVPRHGRSPVRLERFDLRTDANPCRPVFQIRMVLVAGCQKQRRRSRQPPPDIFLEILSHVP